jgi:hypothetical protein
MLHAVAGVLDDDGFCRFRATGPSSNEATELGFLRERPTGIEPA